MNINQLLTTPWPHTSCFEKISCLIKQILRKIRAHAQAIRVRFLQLEFLYYAYARLARYMKCSNYQFCFIRQLIFSKQLVGGQGVVSN